MKKLLMALSLLPLMAAAETEKVGNITWSYSIPGGEAMVEGADPCSGSIVIPSTLGGCSVTEIGPFAFFECDGLKSVTIPSSVTSIAETAFACRMLSSIVVKDGNRAYKIVNGCLLTMDGTVLIRGPSKDVVVIPEGVRVIASWAFFQCNLKSISIPASVETIMCHDPRIFPESGRAFDTCPQLATIRVDPANSFYKSENNCLLTKGGKVLLRGPSVVSATIPEGVEVIADEAFQDCEALVSVTIPSTVVKIGEWAFWWCKALSSLTMPASVQEVSSGFAECTSLRFVRFLGAPPKFKLFEHDAEELALPIRYNPGYAEDWARVVEHYGFTDAEPYDGGFELVPGEKAEFDSGLIGYTASGLPSGLRYDKTTGMITGAATRRPRRRASS